MTCHLRMPSLLFSEKKRGDYPRVKTFLGGEKIGEAEKIPSSLSGRLLKFDPNRITLIYVR